MERRAGERERRAGERERMLKQASIIIEHAGENKLERNPLL